MPSSASEDLFKRVPINQDSSDQDHDLDVAEKQYQTTKLTKQEGRPPLTEGQQALRLTLPTEDSKHKRTGRAWCADCFNPSKLGVQGLLTS